MGFPCGVGMFVGEGGEVGVLKGGPDSPGDMDGRGQIGCAESVVITGDLVDFVLGDPEERGGVRCEVCEVRRVRRGLGEEGHGAAPVANVNACGGWVSVGGW